MIDAVASAIGGFDKSTIPQWAVDALCKNVFDLTDKTVIQTRAELYRLIRPPHAKLEGKPDAPDTAADAAGEN
jgi:hypothetical protein